MMLKTVNKNNLYQRFKKQEYNFIVGIPCSQLKEFCSQLKDDPKVEYIPVTREDIAMGLAVGAYMAGKKPLVFLQNSGLGHLVNIVTSLLKPYGISIHLLISSRCYPFEHFFMHKITKKLLNLLEYEDYTIIEQKNETH